MPDILRSVFKDHENPKLRLSVSVTWAMSPSITTCLCWLIDLFYRLLNKFIISGSCKDYQGVGYIIRKDPRIRRDKTLPGSLQSPQPRFVALDGAGTGAVRGPGVVDLDG